MLSDLVPIRGDTTTTSLPIMAAGNAKHNDFPPANITQMLAQLGIVMAKRLTSSGAEAEGYLRLA